MGEKKKYLLRIDPEIYDALERWAADEYRSVNSHIEFVLRDMLRRAGRLPRSDQSTSATTGEDDASR